MNFWVHAMSWGFTEYSVFFFLSKKLSYFSYYLVVDSSNHGH